LSGRTSCPCRSRIWIERGGSTPRRSACRSCTTWPEFQLGENISVYLIDPANMGGSFTAPHTAQIALRVADVAATREELEGRGVEFKGDILDTGVCHMAFFEDSEGNALMLHRRYAEAA
jgi:hypothetical protein